MKVPEIALISNTPKVTFSDLLTVGYAVQNQITEDYKPIWLKSAKIYAYPNAKDVPPEAYKVYVRDEIPVIGLQGFHNIDENGVPFGMVKFNDIWTITLSHEVLEIIENPFLDKYKKSKLAGGEDVDYVFEIADPVQDKKYAYKKDGVLVSNFITPYWYDLNTYKNTKYDFAGVLTAPRQLAEGGYVSWQNFNGEFLQAVLVQGETKVRNLNAKSPTPWLIGLGLYALLK